MRCPVCITEIESGVYCSEDCERLHSDPALGYGGVSQKRLGEVFDLVKNRENWKYPIDAVVPIGVATVAEIEAAIDFYVGGDAFVTEDRYNMLVTAPGYYAVIGA